MSQSGFFSAGLIVALLAGGVCAQSVNAPEAGQGHVTRVQMSPYTHHYTYDSAHRDVIMLGLEREHPDARLDGLALFRNSFGQESIYLYPWGRTYRTLGGIESLSFKWTAGLLYGYRDSYENKVPLNYKGFSPAVILALDYEFLPGWSGQVNFLGNSALMFQLNRQLK